MLATTPPSARSPAMLDLDENGHPKLTAGNMAELAEQADDSSTRLNHLEALLESLLDRLSIWQALRSK